ncbi:MAG TPA: DUF1501 domain-containing protein, partial [Steroidobacteraceae bacterium]|nr:DUF1501 domain-containing protein [Steroidobacteraceae bacterium]
MTTRPHGLVTRRRFLVGAGALAASAALPTVLFAKTGGSARLVVVILRGALDGLAAAPPHGDPHYALLHRELAIAAPGAADGALGLDSLFGLHPALQFLHERYLGGELVVFHAVASPYRDRSHFDGQNVLENGLTRPLGTADGWLNRALASLPRGTHQERAVAVSLNVPLILRGDAPVLSKSPLETPDIDEDLVARLADLYSKDDWFSARLSEAVQSEKLINAGGGMAASAAAGPPVVAGKPATDRLSGVARMAGTLMHSEEGPEIAVIEASGWDTHANQGGVKGTLAQRLSGLDHALRGLADELGALWEQTAVLVVTEFGRTAAMNGTRGTDHGTGSCAFLAGGAVRGGRVIADWPGLAPNVLLENRDLKPTLDLRSVFKGVLDEHLHLDGKSLAT